MSTQLYFAYGSNLNVSDWRRWCLENGFEASALKFHSTAYLPDHDVAFSAYSTSRQGGVLNVVERKGQVVPGVIFEVAPRGWHALDRKEGAPHAYHRVPKVVVDEVGSERPVETYVVNPARCQDFVQPQQAYIDVVGDGLEAFELTTSSLTSAAAGKETPWIVDGFFVYGTLMRGESRFSAMQKHGLECTLLAQTFGQLADLGTFPGMIRLGSRDGMIKGDFIRLRRLSKAIVALDAIEGFQGFGAPGSLFRRTLTMVDVGDGRIRQAWTYCLANEKDATSLIESGDWRQRCGNRDFVLALIAAGHSQGDPVAITERIAATMPFSFGDRENAIASLTPLQHALGCGTLSERRLAQASGSWVTVV